MTVAELKRAIADLPDDMRVCYNYDCGHSWPGFRCAYVATLPEPFGPRILILDELNPDYEVLPDADMVWIPDATEVYEGQE